MKRYALSALFFFFLFAGIVACNSTQKQKALDTALSVQPPFSNLTIGCNSNVIQNSKGGEILYESGSKITVPANAFVDQNGNPIEGEVKVNFREFNNAAEIMLSGIPMSLVKDGEYKNFESAGMFELTAEHNNQEVQLAEGKHITCQTVTHETENNFDFWYYDPELKEWQEVEGQDKSVSNGLPQDPADEPTSEGSAQPDDIAELENSTMEKPIAPKKADPTLPVFEIGEPAGLDTAVVKERTIGNVSKSTLWQFAPGYDVSEAAMQKVLSGTMWNDYNLVPINKENQVFRLELGNEAKNPIYITPVVYGKDYTEAMAQYKERLEVFNKQVKMVTDVKRSREKAQQFFRTAQVAKMGIHNWDRIKNIPGAVQLQASFELESGAALPPTNQVFMITGKKKSIITFYATMFANFAFEPGQQNALVSILPDDRIAVFKSEEFYKLDVGKLRRSGKHKFVLKTIAGNIANAEDLQKLIETL